jgi:cobyrinic acid a,c-diamide synthase
MSHPFRDSKPAGFILGGLQGSSGKTAITCLLLAGLEARGLQVQPFKAGPDFIDPSYHNRFSTLPSRNLDAWLMGKEHVMLEALRHTRSATGVMEGVMGLFDGAFPTSEEGSTMELARWLNWPVVLCVPAAKAGRSLAISLRGFVEETRPALIAGVVLNGVSGASHTSYLREAIEPLGIPVLGAVPQSELLRWEERHLGLRAAQETMLPSPEAMAAMAEQTLDLSAFSQLASLHPRSATHDAPPSPPASPTRVAIAQDPAFHFYYQANLDWLHEKGAELVPFSPLHSTSLPSKIDALVLGGGFPEMHAEELSANKPLRMELQSAIKGGLRCYAECGGLMLLADKLISHDGANFPMCGVVPGTVTMTRSLQNFGYCLAEGRHPGHEFHHSRWEAEHTHANAWTVARRRLGSSRREGFRTETLHASYVHLYFSNNASLLGPQLGFLK